MDNESNRVRTVQDVRAGKGKKEGRIYKIKSGWIVFPNGKLRGNTIFAGWRDKK